jgi:hypothetical protein
VAREIAAKEITAEDEISSSAADGQITVTYFHAAVWDEVTVFHSAFYDAQKVLPRLFGDDRLSGVTSACLTQELDFTDALGASSRQPATTVCMTRDLFRQANLAASSPDRLFFFAQGKSWPTDGVRFYVHPGVLKKIKFE